MGERFDERRVWIGERLDLVDGLDGERHEIFAGRDVNPFRRSTSGLTSVSQESEELVKYWFSLVALIVPVQLGQPPADRIGEVRNIDRLLNFGPAKRLQ